MRDDVHHAPHWGKERWKCPISQLEDPPGPLGTVGGHTQLRARGFASSHFQDVGAPQPCPLQMGEEGEWSEARWQAPEKVPEGPAHLPPSSGRRALGKQRSGAGCGRGSGGSGPFAFPPAAPPCRGWHRSGGVRSRKSSRGHLATHSSPGERQAVTSPCLKLNLTCGLAHARGRAPNSAVSHGQHWPAAFLDK